MEKILYLECNSGISGDMTVGALLDLGADRGALERALGSLGVGGYHLHFGRTKKCGLDAFDFDVHLEGVEGEHHHHHHEHEGEEEHGHGGGHHHEHGPEGHCHGHEEAGPHHKHGDEVHEHHHHEHGPEGHCHAHEEAGHHHEHGAEAHCHVHGEAEHHHPHVHRNYADICAIIDRLDSNARVKELAKRMFRIVAEAESKAHGLPIDQVHFHEVGAIDSIVDIIGVAVCLDNLGIDNVVVSPLAEGSGYVRCQHGVIPVPVPATANIAQAHGLTLRLTDNDGEMVTPTGAAIAAAVKTMDRLPASCRIVKTGMGAGKKDFKQANVLRATILETEESAGDQMWVMESNIDDCTGEMLGFAMEMILAAGAADVWATPIFMKKNRPAYMLSVLCREDKLEELETLVLTQTTTIGVRRYPVSRTIMDRRNETVSTRFGDARVKVCGYKGKQYFYPEYESVKTICREHGVDFRTAYDEIRRKAEEAR
ncbi:nickel pincer cofactor biosynthesis protein LarC [Enterocloster asparagiformis]|uniref:nickel pincer cofactor biosynthesis protein LarC n=1 Tax=Enterocloster asparagiformis TaxID=333367 RepID=UPI002A83C029|nr:nickel pincer cofactor biosynthesis protein LarC [Enterocloster asparagiformis]